MFGGPRIGLDTGYDDAPNALVDLVELAQGVGHVVNLYAERMSKMSNDGRVIRLVWLCNNSDLILLQFIEPRTRHGGVEAVTKAPDKILQHRLARCALRR